MLSAGSRKLENTFLGLVLLLVNSRKKFLVCVNWIIHKLQTQVTYELGAISETTTKNKKLVHAIFLIVISSIWRARNERIFNNKPYSAARFLMKYWQIHIF